MDHNKKAVSVTNRKFDLLKSFLYYEIFLSLIFVFILATFYWRSCTKFSLIFFYKIIIKKNVFHFLTFNSQNFILHFAFYNGEFSYFSSQAIEQCLKFKSSWDFSITVHLRYSQFSGLLQWLQLNNLQFSASSKSLQLPKHTSREYSPHKL